MARSTDLPFTWKQAAQRYSTRMARRIMNDAVEFSILDGIGLSNHRPQGSIIGFGLASSIGDFRTDQVTLGLLQTATTHVYTACSLTAKDNSDSQISTGCLDLTEGTVLTEREREILLWVARGKTKHQVAETLYISESCVKHYCESIFRKMNTNTLAHSAALAIHSGLINPFK
jgi:DNA-binding CsgD family transcriptional regulator